MKLGLIAEHSDPARGGAERFAADLAEAVDHGAVQRIRPKMMTVTAIMAGLMPIMWSHGTGSEVMKRIAAPMVGGMVSATVLTLVVIPAVYLVVPSKVRPDTTVQMVEDPS